MAQLYQITQILPPYKKQQSLLPFIVALTAQHDATLPVSYNELPTLSRVDACDHRQRCCTLHGLCTGPSATMPSPLPLREPGTRYHWRSRHCRHCRLSSVHWRRNCFTDCTTTHTSGNSCIDTSL